MRLFLALLVSLTSVSCTGDAKVLKMKASAFALEGLTAAGTPAREGIVAADPGVLALGTRIRVSGAGPYDGVYIVTDTGRHISGNEIDIYVPTSAEAKRFGVRTVSVTVLEPGEGKADARAKDREAKKQ